MGKTMAKEEMNNFIKKVGRTELYDEMKERPGKNLRYLKAVRVSLVSLGYDERWVDDEFRTALEAAYPSESKPTFDIEDGSNIVYVDGNRIELPIDMANASREEKIKFIEEENDKFGY